MLIPATLAALVAFVDASCLLGTSHLQRRVTHNNTVEVSKFGYTGQIGPLLWQTLAAENSVCENGENQSPINLDDTVQRAKESPKINIQNPQSAEFENLGTTVEVIANGTTEFGNKTFNLKQFHFHSPSEHRINEEYFPLEMHMVHEAADKSITVLGLLFDVSDQNTPLIGDLAKAVSKISTPGAITQSGPLDLAAITKHLETTPLRQYSGSLTTPPCKEGITFLIAEQPLPVDPASFNAMKKVLKFNSRFTQGPLGELNLIERARSNGSKNETTNGSPQSTSEPAQAVDPRQTATKVDSTIYAESTLKTSTVAPRSSTPAKR